MTPTRQKIWNHRLSQGRVRYVTRFRKAKGAKEPRQIVEPQYLCDCGNWHTASGARSDVDATPEDWTLDALRRSVPNGCPNSQRVGW